MNLLTSIIVAIPQLLTGHVTYGTNSEVLDKIEASSFLMDALKGIGYALLKGLAQMLDGVSEAISKLLALDFLNSIPAIAAIKDAFPPLAWIVFGLFLLIGAIILMTNHEKIKMTDFAKSIITSAMLIVALPMLISAFGEMKTAGVSDTEGLINGGGSGGTTQNSTGKTIINSVTVDVEASVAAKELVYLSEGFNPYAISATDKLNKTSFPNKLQSNKQYSLEFLMDAASLKAYGMKRNDFDYLEMKTRYQSGYYPVAFYQDLKKARSNNVDLEKVEKLLKDIEKNSKKEEDGDIPENPDISEDNPSAEAKAMLEKYKEEYNFYLENLKSVYFTSGGYTYEQLATVSIPIVGEVSILGEYIYAYQTDFLAGFILVIITMIALIFAGFKIANLLFDLLFNQLIAPLVFASDLHGSGRSKKMIQNMLSTYLVFIIIILLMGIFLEVSGWVMKQDFGMSGLLPTMLLKVFVLGGCAKGLIDGPDLIVSILGLDAGVKSGMAVIAGGAAAVGVVKGASAAVKGAASAPLKAINSIRNENPIAKAQSISNDAHRRKEQYSENHAAKGYDFSYQNGTAPPSSSAANESSNASSSTADNPMHTGKGGGIH